MLPSLHLFSIYMIVSLFGNDIKIHPAKLNPKAEENISIHHIVQTIPQHNNIYFVLKSLQIETVTTSNSPVTQTV